jgi:spermidine synthase
VLADHRVQRVVVVEIEDVLVRWMRDGTIRHGPALLADERLTVMTADIRVAMAEATPEAYDLILLDVDNGPDFLVYDANAAVYESPFLTACRDALARRGLVAVWSADTSPALTATLEAVFGSTQELALPVVLQTRHTTYHVFLASRR